MKKSIITAFAAATVLATSFAAASGASQPAWHEVDHGAIMNLQAAPQQGVSIVKKDDSIKFLMPDAKQSTDNGYQPLRRTSSR